MGSDPHSIGLGPCLHSCITELRRARPKQSTARRPRAPWMRAAPGGSGARGEDGAGASTARASSGSVPGVKSCIVGEGRRTEEHERRKGSDPHSTFYAMTTRREEKAEGRAPHGARGRRGGEAPPGGSGARGEEGTGAGTARARGTSSDLLLSRAVQRPAAQSGFGPRRLK